MHFFTYPNARDTDPFRKAAAQKSETKFCKIDPQQTQCQLFKNYEKHL